MTATTLNGQTTVDLYRTSFLDTHPASLERMARMQKIARYFRAGQAAQVFLQSARLDKQPAP